MEKLVINSFRRRSQYFLTRIVKLSFQHYRGILGYVPLYVGPLHANASTQSGTYPYKRQPTTGHSGYFPLNVVP